METVPGVALRAPKTEAQFRRWARQLMRAIRFLHSRGITHGHIHPQVIIVDGDTLTLVGLEKRAEGSHGSKPRARAQDYLDAAESLLRVAKQGVSRTTGLLKQLSAEADALDWEGVGAIVAAL